MSGYRAKKLWGEAIEDRGSQVTFSALGQQAPLAEKEKVGSRFHQTEEDHSDPEETYPGVFRPYGRCNVN